MLPTHDHEELLNGKLAELLREQGLDARPERRESGRRMDVVVDVGGARVVLEAEAGFSSAKRREAVKDADGRPMLRAARPGKDQTMTDWDNLIELFERVRPGYKDGRSGVTDSEAVDEVRRDDALERPTADPELLLMRAVGVYSQAVDMDPSVLYGRTFTLRDCLDAVIAANAAAVQRWRAGKD